MIYKFLIDVLKKWHIHIWSSSSSSNQKSYDGYTVSPIIVAWAEHPRKPIPRLSARVPKVGGEWTQRTKFRRHRHIKQRARSAASRLVLPFIYNSYLSVMISWSDGAQGRMVSSPSPKWYSRSRGNVTPFPCGLNSEINNAVFTGAGFWNFTCQYHTKFMWAEFRINHAVFINFLKWMSVL